MTSPSTFDLIHQPWIRVRTLAGVVEERSLRDTLAEASTLRGLAGDIPTQDIALLRLLLAVILGATRSLHVRTEKECLDLFEEWWARGAVPMEVLDPYLERVCDRFDLLHNETPFYQVAGLSTLSGKRTGLSKLIADLPPNHRLFTTRGGEEIESLSLAEAARWLVHCQAFDPSGIKTGAAGDDRVKGGRGYPFGYPAWAGNLGLVVAEGRTLFETLLFNAPWRMSGPDDLPVWERAPVGPGVDSVHPGPLGPADLFTWPSRRLRLFMEGGEWVTDVQISNGDRLTPQDQFHFEPMSAWRHSKAQSSAGQRVMMPITHDPSRRIWQGLAPLLQHPADRASLCAPVVEWLNTLRYQGVLDSTRLIDLRVVGLEYGTQNSVIVGAVDDRLAASVAALTDPTLVQTAADAAGQASQGVLALANLAGNLDRAAGGEGNARERAFEAGYALLDGPFREWMLQLTDPALVAHYHVAWAVTAAGVLRRAGHDLVADAGSAAYVGRHVSRAGTDNPQLLDAGLALLWFGAALAKVFPQAKPQPNEVIS